MSITLLSSKRTKSHFSDSVPTKIIKSWKVEISGSAEGAYPYIVKLPLLSLEEALCIPPPITYSPDHNLSKIRWLMGPDCIYSRRPTHTTDVPDFNCHRAELLILKTSLDMVFLPPMIDHWFLRREHIGALDLKNSSILHRRADVKKKRNLFDEEQLKLSHFVKKAG
ncbi:kinase-like domain-containing protein [Rhizophagus irregularis DAOM 181602=DAOM 197198]|nr:kinase-like domain-containing protein [Rhizophagus irregularis DAOM 181602=DAOM 197198]